MKGKRMKPGVSPETHDAAHRMYKYGSIFAGISILCMLAVVLVRKPNTTASSQVEVTASSNSTITVEGNAEISFPTRK